MGRGPPTHAAASPPRLPRLPPSPLLRLPEQQQLRAQRAGRLPLRQLRVGAWAVWFAGHPCQQPGGCSQACSPGQLRQQQLSHQLALQGSQQQQPCRPATPTVRSGCQTEAACLEAGLGAPTVCSCCSVSQQTLGTKCAADGGCTTQAAGVSAATACASPQAELGSRSAGVPHWNQMLPSVLVPHRKLRKALEQHGPIVTWLLVLCQNCIVNHSCRLCCSQCPSGCLQLRLALLSEACRLSHLSLPAGGAEGTEAATAWAQYPQGHSKQLHSSGCPCSWLWGGASRKSGRGEGKHLVLNEHLMAKLDHIVWPAQCSQQDNCIQMLLQLPVSLCRLWRGTSLFPPLSLHICRD